MGSARETLLVVTVGICFLPAVLGMLWSLVAVVGMAADDEHFHWVNISEPLVFLLAGGAGLVGAAYMLQFLLNGRRDLPRLAMAIYTLMGLSVAGGGAWSFMSSGSPFLSVVFSAPFACGLLLLFLGRSYFSSANKTMEPTR
jgi:hypothetical protein